MKIISIHYYRKNYFHLKLTNCPPQITYLMVSQVSYLYMGYINKEISFGDIVYFEPKIYSI